MELAYQLELLDVDVDLSDFSEPLEQLELFPKPGRNHERRPGFKAAQPREYFGTDDEAADTVRQRNKNWDETASIFDN